MPKSRFNRHLYGVPQPRKYRKMHKQVGKKINSINADKPEEWRSTPAMREKAGRDVRLWLRGVTDANMHEHSAFYGCSRRQMYEHLGTTKYKLFNRKKAEKFRQTIDHIMPLNSAVSQYEFDLLQRWENLCIMTQLENSIKNDFVPTEMPESYKNNVQLTALWNEYMEILEELE